MISEFWSYVIVSITAVIIMDVLFYLLLKLMVQYRAKQILKDYVAPIKKTFDDVGPGYRKSKTSDADIKDVLKKAKEEILG